MRLAGRLRKAWTEKRHSSSWRRGTMYTVPMWEGVKEGMPTLPPMCLKGWPGFKGFD